jgi:hypothetical protein
MAHIMGLTFVSSGQVFSLDESGSNFEASAPINAITPAVPVGQLIDNDFRVYAGTTDGNIAVFHRQISNPLQLFHVTDQPVLWSLYHAARTLYLGTETSRRRVHFSCSHSMTRP